MPYTVFDTIRRELASEASIRAADQRDVDVNHPGGSRTSPESGPKPASEMAAVVRAATGGCDLPE